MGGFRDTVAQGDRLSSQCAADFGRQSSRDLSPNKTLSGDDRAAAAGRPTPSNARRRRTPRRRAAKSTSSARGRAIPIFSTFRALRLMQKADVVLYDRLTNPDVINLVRREAERIYVGKQPEDHELPQGDISALLVKLAREGKRVLAAKGRRSLHVRPGRRGDRSPRRRRDPVSGVPGGHGGDRRGGLCRHSPYPSRPRAGVRIRDRPRQGRQDPLDWTALLHRGRRLRFIWGCAMSRRSRASSLRAAPTGFAGGDH